MPLSFLPIHIEKLQPKNIEVFIAFQERKTADEKEIIIGILKIKGKYSRGSQGAPVGEFLRGLRVFVQEFYRLDALVIDLTELEYEWGNNLSGLFESEKWTLKEPEYWLGTFLMLSESNEEGIMSLLKTFKPKTGIPKIISHYEEVFDFIH